MSAAPTSSWVGSRWAVTRMWRPRLVASSSAVSELSRPTDSGARAWGNRTASRSGIRGRVLGPCFLGCSPPSVSGSAELARRPRGEASVDAGLDLGRNVTSSSCEYEACPLGIPGVFAYKPGTDAAPGTFPLPRDLVRARFGWNRRRAARAGDVGGRRPRLVDGNWPGGRVPRKGRETAGVAQVDQRLKGGLALLVEDAQDAVQLASVESISWQLRHQPDITIGIKAVLHGKGAEVLAKQQLGSVLVVLARSPHHEEIEGDAVGSQDHGHVHTLPPTPFHAHQP